MTKAEQTKWVKIKPKPSMKNKSRKRNYKYMEWFANQNFACFICGTKFGVEGHHIKEHSTDRKIDESMMPLCTEHHKGNTISPHGTPSKFKALYPIETQREIGLSYYNTYLKEKGTI